MASAVPELKKALPVMGAEPTCGESPKLMVWPPVRKCRPSCTRASTTSLHRLPDSAGGAAASATASEVAAQQQTHRAQHLQPQVAPLLQQAPSLLLSLCCSAE